MNEAFASIALIAAFALVSTFDKEEEDRQVKEYCSKVKDGSWPDYKSMYSTECKTI